MKRHATPSILLALILALGGCGSGTRTTTTGGSTNVTTASRTTTPAASLEQAVRKAVEEDHRLSVEALWTNQVPANHPATDGPNLLVLRQSVAQRRAQGVRVKMLSEQFRILGVQLDPSYTTATATILDSERVQPSFSDGRPRGKPSATREHARLELRRVGATERFVVWKVTLL